MRTKSGAGPKIVRVRIISNGRLLITMIFILARAKEKPHALRRGVWCWGSPSFEQSIARRAWALQPMRPSCFYW